jgi:glycerol-1-phosphate dehydrogenase [NAD(P)+]
MELPEVQVLDETLTEAEASAELGALLGSLGIEAPFVVASPHGVALTAHVKGTVEQPDGRADQEWAAQLGARAHRSGADAIVAVGGGRCLDVGKLAAARAGLRLVAVPTQLSHDGICSPVAVVPNEDGRTESIGAIAPRAVCLPMSTLLGAPVASARAGVGDLLANPLALRDWRLAIDRGLDEYHGSAWDLSVESFERIEPWLDDFGDAHRNPDFHRRLADALILSGLAMIHAGTSRPASGAEHEISHAIDELFSGRALHGAQVAFGCVFSAALYGDDVSAFRGRLARMGLPQHPADLGLSRDDVTKILLEAPDTRPGRFTVLEAADLDERSAHALVGKIFADL